uniref:C2 calcium lipid binding region CaLB n=1 Tax=Echinococcus granulosus TaxID=6210 RepID=A0A068WP04_ECHGR|nr:C2 calcium lipid binding region CaLB [Echinococcus granulosus]
MPHCDSCHKKKVCTLEPGPNPFRAPIILNVYIKYDERKQALDVLVRNLQNTPLKRKVRVNTKFILPTNPQLMEEKKLLKRFRSQERCPDGVVIVDARRTSKKRGPNPRFNEDFHFTPLIARDVKMGKLVFDIYEVKKKHKSFLGTIELCGSEIELKCDMAYSLYLHNPTCGSTLVTARDRSTSSSSSTPSSSSSSSTSSSSSHSSSSFRSQSSIACLPKAKTCPRSASCERRVATCKRGSSVSMPYLYNYETACYQPTTSSKSVSPSSSLPSLPSTIALLPSKAKTLSLNASRNAIYEVINTEVTKSPRKQGTLLSSPALSAPSSSSTSQDSDITVYEVIHVDPRKITKYGACGKSQVKTSGRLRLYDTTCSDTEKNVIHDVSAVAVEPVSTSACPCSSPKIRTALPVTAVLPSQQSSSLSSLPFSPCRETTVLCGDCDSSTDEVAIMLRADILYNERRQRMSVFIRNLEHVDEKLKHSVRCMLYTADGRRMEKQTKCKRGCNPYFNEEFKFRNLVRSDIRGGQLLFSVVQKHKKNVVGVGIIPGCRINLDRDEAHNIPICSKIPNKFVYNMEDVTREPESLIRIIYPKSSDHIEVYQ